MTHFGDHLTPVSISFAGLCISAITSLVNMCSHHDRPFQLLSTRTLGCNITLPIIAPILFVVEFAVFMFLCHFDLWGLADNVQFHEIGLLFLPLIPTLLSTVSSAINVKITAPHNRDSFLSPFRRRVNADQQMLLESRQNGVPAILGDPFTEAQANGMVRRHLGSLFWAELACVVVDVVFAAPWIYHFIDWIVSD